MIRLAQSLPVQLALAAALLGSAHVQARDVVAGPDDVIEVRARLRFATAVVLPDGERILDWVCGDAERWSVQGAANLAFVKPRAARASTSVTLVTDRGNVYTLLFREIGDDAAEADLKLRLSADGPPDLAPSPSQPRLLESLETTELLEAQAAEAREQARLAKERALRDVESETERFRSSYPRTLRFDYILKPAKASSGPFHLRAIWSDDRSTYIRADPDQPFALYEEREGQPEPVPFDSAEGLYVVPRLLDSGWLQIGKRQLRFQRARP